MSCLRRDSTRTCDILPTGQMLYKLSYQGSSVGQAKPLRLYKGEVISPLLHIYTSGSLGATLTSLQGSTNETRQANTNTLYIAMVMHVSLLHCSVW